jgi:hypothetical protein
MRPTEEQIKQLMATVACAACGAKYQPDSVDVLGHRDELWFLRVSCTACATSGLVAALVRGSEAPVAEAAVAPPDEAEHRRLDQAASPGLVTRADVLRMRRFLAAFDGDFNALFNDSPGEEPRSAA